MNLHFAAAILALAVTPAALFAAEGTFDKTLHVTGPATLNVSTDAGYIHITPGPDGSVHIIGHVHASGSLFGGSAEERAKEVADHPPIAQNGDSIEVGQHTNYRNIAIDYVITAPRGTTVQAASGSGNISVTNLGAPLTAKSNAGDIYANGLTGNVALSIGSGNIQALLDHVGNARIASGTGSIRLMGVTSGLYAEAGSGDIEVQGQPASDWKIISGSGNITLDAGANARFTIDATTGSGFIKSDLAIVTLGNSDPHHVAGDINGGGPNVHIGTDSGNVIIH
ncbi:MAG: DUF4097 family beta strand repeat-containing protein [Acidobacteriaceae bacterium]